MADEAMEDAEGCTVCQGRLDNNAFTWPGCHDSHGQQVAHRLCAHCLAGLLRNLPGWPRARPDAQQAVAVVRLAVRRGTPGRNDPNPPLPHIPCPVCRQRWSDIDSIARAALAMPQWPEPTVPEQAAVQQAPALQQAPRTPAVPTVMCGGPQREEMDWTTYQRQIRDRTDPLPSTRGAWIGEWHCTARACAGTHTAEAEFTGVRTLW